MPLLTDDIWAHAAAREVMTDLDYLKNLSRLDARTVFMRAGFHGDGLDIAYGVSYAECGSWLDAVGDVSLVDDQWGPSIGAFQIRALRNPMGFGAADRWRYAWALRVLDYNARAAFALSDGGEDWRLWSTFQSGAYQEHYGHNFVFRSGHANADKWSA